MIKTLVFDFGNVFINLDIQGTIAKAKALFGHDIIREKRSKDNASIFRINDDYEKGLISTEDFIAFYSHLADGISRHQMIALWNGLIKDFPLHRLEFAQQLKQENKYQLILLSNTNELHIDYIKEQVPFYNSFKACFHKFYLSHEIHLRKPNADIFEFVLQENNALPHECLFIDDTLENTEMAKRLGWHTWHIDNHKEDITDLFRLHHQLFKR